MWTQTLAEAFLSGKHRKDSTLYPCTALVSDHINACSLNSKRLESLTWPGMSKTVLAGEPLPSLCVSAWKSQHLCHSFPSHVHRHIWLDKICQEALGMGMSDCVEPSSTPSSCFCPSRSFLLSFTFWREEVNLTPFVRNNIPPLELHSPCLESYQIQTHGNLCCAWMKSSLTLFNFKIILILQQTQWYIY